MEESNDYDVEICVHDEKELIKFDKHKATTHNEKTEAASNASIDKVIIVFAGKSGAGKSTLIKTLLEQEKDNELSAKPNTECAEHLSFEKNDVTINIIDTLDVQKEFHLLVYCMSVAPGTRFHDANPTIMQKLKEMYSNSIWKHCIIVLTFSNVARDRSIKYRTEDEGITFYKQYIEDYTKCFEEELKKLQVKNTTANTIFNPDHPPVLNAITAIPAGDEPEDSVLPGVELHKHSRGWVDEIFLNMIKKCKYGEKLALYRYGCEQSKDVLKIDADGDVSVAEMKVGGGKADEGPPNGCWSWCRRWTDRTVCCSDK